MDSRRRSLDAACSAAGAAVASAAVDGSAETDARRGSKGCGRGSGPRVVASWAVITVKAGIRWSLDCAHAMTNNRRTARRWAQAACDYWPRNDS